MDKPISSLIYRKRDSNTHPVAEPSVATQQEKDTMKSIARTVLQAIVDKHSA